MGLQKGFAENCHFQGSANLHILTFVWIQVKAFDCGAVFLGHFGLVSWVKAQPLHLGLELATYPMKCGRCFCRVGASVKFGLVTGSSLTFIPLLNYQKSNYSFD